MIVEWRDGENDYRINRLTLNDDNKHTFNVELTDVELPDYKSINDVFYDILSGKNVELLYSGGLDSEAILRSCMVNKINVKPITMRLMYNGSPMNTHDLYYSEKFCRENDLKQTIIDLDVKQFFENGKHFEYLVPYHIDEPHVATHFWLFEQCSSFPVIGGDYSWPWVTEKIISPHRLSYNSYNRFLCDKNISGVGNLLGHSLAANIFCIKTHTSVFGAFTSNSTVNMIKRRVFEDLGLGPLELRFRSYGWENFAVNQVNKVKHKIDLLKIVGTVKSTVTWGKTIAEVMGTIPGSNDRFY